MTLPPAKKLLDQVREALRTKHYASRTEKSYVDWITRYILFHQKRHPKDMGADEVRAFITYLATQRQAAASPLFAPPKRSGAGVRSRLDS